MYALCCAADAGMETKTALCPEVGVEERGLVFNEKCLSPTQALIYKGFFGEPGFLLSLFQCSRSTLKVWFTKAGNL